MYDPVLPLEWSCRTENGIQIIQVKETVYPWRKAHIFFTPLQQRTFTPLQRTCMVLGWAAVTVGKYNNGRGTLA